jgi:hypothetical protein
MAKMKPEKDNLLTVMARTVGSALGTRAKSECRRG